MYRYKSIAAGFVIGLACLANLAIGNVLGAFFFSVGLMSVCVLGLDLFTGKVRDLTDSNITPIQWLLMLIGNFLGVALMALIGTSLPYFREVIKPEAILLEQSRLAVGWGNIIMRGAVCGACVQLAVDMWKATKNVICIIIPTMLFVLLGANHCVADMFYCIYGGNWINVLQIFEALIGNVSGAMIVVVLTKTSAYFSRSLDKLPR